MLLLLNVEGLHCFFWMLFNFLFIFFYVEGSYFYFFMLKVIALTFGCSKFLLLVLDVASSCSYTWILKVLTTLFLDVEGFCFYS